MRKWMVKVIQYCDWRCRVCSMLRYCRFTDFFDRIKNNRKRTKILFLNFGITFSAITNSFEFHHKTCESAVNKNMKNYFLLRMSFLLSLRTS